MSKVTGKPPTHWRRPITRTYDYNLSLGENYYKPQLEYLSSRKGRGSTPPSASTFAERLLKYPPTRQRSASASQRAEEAELGFSSTAAASSSSAAASSSMREASRYASLDDLGLDEDFAMRRRKQLLSLQSSQENLAADRGKSPLLSPALDRKRVTFGEKMLDALGVKEVQSKMEQKSSLFSSEDGDALDRILAERRNRRQQALTIQSADADLFTEDPMKSPQMSSRIQQARLEMDQMRDEMRKDSDAATSRFRQRLRAKREKEAREEQDHYGSLSALNDLSSSMTSSSSMGSSSTAKAMSSSSTTTSSAMKLGSSSLTSSSTMQQQRGQNSLLAAEAAQCDADTEAILSKVDQIRKRAKARMAQITDDFGDLQIESSLASRRAATRSRQAGLMDDEFDSDLMSSSRLANNSGSGASGRSVTVTRKTMRASYDVE